MNVLSDLAMAPQLVSDDRVSEHPVGLVLVGANFGAKIARQLAQVPGQVRVTGVCDLEPTRARELAGELGVRVYATLEDVLSDPTVEAVGVFTGPAGRGGLIERIARAGKHVMTTKPFELQVEAAEGAFAAAERCGRVLHLNSPAPCPAGDAAKIQSWLMSGELGRPVTLQAQTWANYQEVADGSWMDDPARCPGGPLFRLGVYFLNDFAGLLGKPLRVQVQQARVRTGRPTPDNAQISIEYEGGALANIFTSFCVGDGRAYRDEVMIACEKGTVRRWMERAGGVEMDGDRAVVELLRPGAEVDRFVTAAGDYAGWYDWKGFHAAVRGLPGSVARNREATVAGVRLLAAMARSAQSGRSEAV
jgi:predicted dehydrogenase